MTAADAILLSYLLGAAALGFDAWRARAARASARARLSEAADNP
jgi:hypothetical protein